MKKTVFVGRVNDQEFDNVQDYNACVQAMVDMGKDFQATSSTQVVEVPNDECTCGPGDECNKCVCGKDTSAKKQLKPVTTYLPAFETRENGEYIDKFINLDEDNYDNAMDELDNYLNEVYKKVSEARAHNTDEQLGVYGKAVAEMREVLKRDLDVTSKALEPINNRINELEAELDCLYEKSYRLSKAADVVTTYSEFYNAIAELLNPTDKVEEVSQGSETQEASVRLTRGFADLLREIFG